MVGSEKVSSNQVIERLGLTYYQMYWPQSKIAIHHAICLSEIVNSPDEYVSRSPHLVINKLDWIQTRYLFVQGSRKEWNSDEEVAANQVQSPVLQQEPTMTPKGVNGNAIVIPMSVIPSSRRSKLDKAPEKKVEKKTQGRETKFPKKAKVEVLDEESSSSTTKKDSSDQSLNKSDDSASIITLDEDLVIFDKFEAPEAFTSFRTRFLQRLSNLFKCSRTQINDTLSQSTTNGTTVASTTNFAPGKLDYSTLPILPPPTDAALGVSKQLLTQFKQLKKTQDTTPQNELGWYTDPDQLDNPFQWIVELHSFPSHLPLTKQMCERGISSVVLELRFPSSYPFAPPFIRVIRPRFLPFHSGGGGHVTLGGSLCMELLTTDGWLATYDLSSVLFQIRLALCSEEPRPAQLDHGRHGSNDYGIGEAVDAYIRACQAHGWRVPPGLRDEIRASNSGRAPDGL
jgi:ubiquitin-conjugating enzyme E2 Q